MGHWGLQPWENDSAADWLDEFAEQTGLIEKISDGLELPLTEIDKVRAAAHVLLSVSAAGLLESQSREDLACLAIGRLSEAIESELFTNPGFRALVLSEIAGLRSLLTSSIEAGPKPEMIVDEVQQMAVEQFRLHLYHVIDIDGVTAEFIAKDLVGTGFLDEDGVMHLQFDDGRENGFTMTCRCVPAERSDQPPAE